LLRDASVSSIRSTSAPPDCRATTQLKSADLAPPTWNMPVGDGAKRNRGWEGAADMVFSLEPVAGWLTLAWASPGSVTLTPDFNGVISTE
jgi:hypothetical protein